MRARSYASILLSCIARLSGVKSLTSRQSELLANVAMDTKAAAKLWDSEDWDGLRALRSSLAPTAHIDVLDDSATGEAANCLARAWWGLRKGDGNEVIARCSEAMDFMGWQLE